MFLNALQYITLAQHFMLHKYQSLFCRNVELHFMHFFQVCSWLPRTKGQYIYGAISAINWMNSKYLKSSSAFGQICATSIEIPGNSVFTNEGRIGTLKGQSCSFYSIKNSCRVLPASLKQYCPDNRFNCIWLCLALNLFSIFPPISHKYDFKH